MCHKLRLNICLISISWALLGSYLDYDLPRMALSTMRLRPCLEILPDSLEITDDLGVPSELFSPASSESPSMSPHFRSKGQGWGGVRTFGAYCGVKDLIPGSLPAVIPIWSVSLA